MTSSRAHNASWAPSGALPQQVLCPKRWGRWILGFRKHARSGREHAAASPDSPGADSRPSYRSLRKWPRALAPTTGATAPMKRGPAPLWARSMPEVQPKAAPQMTPDFAGKGTAWGRLQGFLSCRVHQGLPPHSLTALGPMGLRRLLRSRFNLIMPKPIGPHPAFPSAWMEPCSKFRRVEPEDKQLPLEGS